MTFGAPGGHLEEKQEQEKRQLFTQDLQIAQAVQKPSQIVAWVQ